MFRLLFTIKAHGYKLSLMTVRLKSPNFCIKELWLEEKEWNASHSTADIKTLTHYNSLASCWGQDLDTSLLPVLLSELSSVPSHMGAGFQPLDLGHFLCEASFVLLFPVTLGLYSEGSLPSKLWFLFFSVFYECCLNHLY